MKVFKCLSPFNIDKGFKIKMYFKGFFPLCIQLLNCETAINKLMEMIKYRISHFESIKTLTRSSFSTVEYFCCIV